MRLASALWGTGKDRGDRGGVGEGSDLGDEFWDYEVTPFALPPGLHLVRPFPLWVCAILSLAFSRLCSSFFP